MVRKSSAARGALGAPAARGFGVEALERARRRPRARDRSRGAEGVDARIDPVRARRPARGREGDAPEAAALAAPALQGLGDGGPVPGSAQPLDLLAKERVLLRGESSGQEGQTAVAGREFESRGRAARARRRDPSGRGVGKIPLGEGFNGGRRMFDFDPTPESGRAARARPRPSAPPASRSSSPSSRSHPPRSSSSRALSFGLVCAARAGEVRHESVERGGSG